MYDVTVKRYTSPGDDKMKRRKTLKDVAREAEVSVTMASRVLSNYGYFSEESKSRVLKAAQKLNYKPDAIARSLKTGQTKAIGVIISDVLSFFFTTLVRGIEDVASQNNYSVILCNSDEDPDKERKYLSVLYERGVDGLIVSPSTGNHTYLKNLAKGGVPLVLVDRRIRGLKVPTVTVDNEAGSYEAVSHLIKSGHRRIGIITGLKGIMTSEERLAGYKRALEEHGLPVKEELIKEGDYRREKAKEKSLEFLRMKNPPSALFVCNEPMTSGALLALRKNKVKIPEKIAIIGFDDPVWAPLNEPALSTVSQPSYSMGTLACQTLLKQLRGAPRNEMPSEDIILKPKLIVRESCGARRPERGL